MTSCFDLDKFKSLFESRGKERKDLVFMARTAEAAERYEDMCKFMRELVCWADKNGEDLVVEERNLLSVAYKNVIGARRASWRTLNTDDHTSEDNQEEKSLMSMYRVQIEGELDAICQDVLDLLEQKLIKNSEKNSDKDKNGGEARVFYLKMAADYYRYLAECVTDKKYDDKAKEFYERASAIASEELLPTHPIRLGLALNYSVCLYEIKKNKKEACDLAKKAFDDAISKLDKLEEADYKDSTLIMQLLRDNLTLWTSTDQDANPDDEEES